MSKALGTGYNSTRRVSSELQIQAPEGRYIQCEWREPNGTFFVKIVVQNNIEHRTSNVEFWIKSQFTWSFDVPCSEFVIQEKTKMSAIWLAAKLQSLPLGFSKWDASRNQRRSFEDRELTA